MAGDKTEKATPKKREEARAKGQVAKSMDLNGAAVLLAGFFVLGLVAPSIGARCAEAMRDTLALVQDAPDVVTRDGVGTVVATAAQRVVLAVAPVVATCMAAGVLMSVAQVRFRITP